MFVTWFKGWRNRVGVKMRIWYRALRLLLTFFWSNSRSSATSCVVYFRLSAAFTGSNRARVVIVTHLPQGSEPRQLRFSGNLRGERKEWKEKKSNALDGEERFQWVLLAIGIVSQCTPQREGSTAPLRRLGCGELEHFRLNLSLPRRVTMVTTSYA